MTTDPIADMLTRIRNAGHAGFDEVCIPGSKIKTTMAKILKDAGYIRDFRLEEDDKQGIIHILLKYKHTKNKKINVINELKRISKPSCRVYVPKEEVPLVKNGLGIAIISTSNGVMTDKEARDKGVGGEVLCSVW